MGKVEEGGQVLARRETLLLILKQFQITNMIMFSPHRVPLHKRQVSNISTSSVKHHNETHIIETTVMKQSKKNEMVI